MTDEIYYSIALTRMTGFNQQMALQLYQALAAARPSMTTATTLVM